MSDFTQFMSNVVNVYPTDAPDPFFAQYLDTLNEYTRYNVKYRQVTAFDLVAAGTKTFTLPNAALTDWQFVVVRVVGEVRVDTVAKDTDGSTTINGYVPVYGIDIFPGILQFSTYNITSFTLTAVDDSVGEIYVGVCEVDS